MSSLCPSEKSPGKAPPGRAPYHRFISSRYTKNCNPLQKCPETNSPRGHNDHSPAALTEECTNYYATTGFYASRSWQQTRRVLTRNQWKAPENKGKGCCARCTPYWQQQGFLSGLVKRNERECKSGLTCAVPSSEKDKKKGYCVAQNRVQEIGRQIKNIALSPVGAEAGVAAAGAAVAVAAGVVGTGTALTAEMYGLSMAEMIGAGMEPWEGGWR